MDGSILDAHRDEVPSDGYVVSTLEASIWCVTRNATYADAVLAAVNLGGDTDTTGAVTGGMAGLIHGFSAIPRSWVEAIARSDEVVALAERFAAACQRHWSGPDA